MGFKERFVCGSSDCAGSKDGAMDVYWNVYGDTPCSNSGSGSWHYSGFGYGDARGCGEPSCEGSGHTFDGESLDGVGHGFGNGNGSGSEFEGGEG